MVKWSFSHLPVDEGEDVIDGMLASVACMLCKKRQQDCLFMPGKFACVACQQVKVKCLGVLETWRSGPQIKNDMTRATVPSKSQQRSMSHGPAAVAKKFHQRSTSWAPQQNDNATAPAKTMNANSFQAG